MSTRLQVVMADEEYRDLQAVAREQRVTVAEWVRQTLRRARDDRATVIEARLRAIDEAYHLEVPTGEEQVGVRQMIAESGVDYLT